MGKGNVAHGISRVMIWPVQSMKQSISTDHRTTAEALAFDVADRRCRLDHNSRESDRRVAQTLSSA